MIDLSEEEGERNINTTARYLERAALMKQWLDIEIGITSGGEDGVDNESVDDNALYTQPENFLNICTRLSKNSPYFSIAAGFGNVHYVYKLGNVEFYSELLSTHQKYVAEKTSNAHPFKDVISYGVVKVNLDMDMQYDESYDFLEGIRDYYFSKDHISTQVGNPEGKDKLNKKYYDPRLWVREGEKTLCQRVIEALDNLNTRGQL